MKKIDGEIIAQIRDYAVLHPETSYNQIAATFCLSVISVKRYCSDLGRSKKWRKGCTSGAADPQKFWSRVDRKPNQCWVWTGCLNADGYGFVHWNGSSRATHRLAFEFERGQIPEGMDLDHLCRNRSCCNPEHLTPVTHRENMERAGIIPRATSSTIDTQAEHVDTGFTIDTASSGSPICDRDTAASLIKENSLTTPTVDTTPQLRLVSIGQDSAQTVQPGRTPANSLVHSARPKRPDPFTAICVMQKPPELELLQHPARQESPSGAKADLGIEDWAETEFGPFWWGLTDEQLRRQTVFDHTEVMRARGEFLHWYAVTPSEPSKTPTYMSARTGPEACAKVERGFGKGWAASWEYLRPDPHRGPFFYHRVRFIAGGTIVLVARTIPDAIAMIEEIWGPAVVLECERLNSRPENGQLTSWSRSWKEFLKRAHKQLG